MSLVVTVFVNEGIVMASDSRCTYNIMEKNTQQNTVVHKLGVHTNNSTIKTFLCPNNNGLSVCGEASIKGKPITGFIESFIRERISPDTDIDEVPQKIINYFGRLDPKPNAMFTVAGYHKSGEGNNLVQRVYKVRLQDGKIDKLNTETQGATWEGESLTLTRLLQPVALKGRDGNYQDLPHSEIAWNFFTLQDAVDFCNYAIKTTIDTMHFQSVVETVGSPINTLVIKPEETRWIAKQELHC